MCTYTFFSARRNIALAEFVKIRTGSAKMARKEQVCAQKSHTESLPKYLCVVVHARDCSCALILRHQMAPQQSRIQNRKFSSIL